MRLMERIPAGLRAMAARALLPELRVSPEDPRISLSDPRIIELVFGGGGRSKSGVAISEQNALSIATVYACVRVLSETIASLPLIVYQVSDDGKSRTVAARHAAYPLLHDAPNEFMTSFVWRELAMSHALLWGNHYSQIIWSGAGRVLELWPLLPWQVKPKLVDGGRRKIYEVRYNDGREELPGDEVLHIPALSLNGLEGMSPIAKLREHLGVKVATRDFSATFFANGLRPSAILETPGTLNPQASKNLTESVAEKFGALNDKFKVMVLEQGAKLHMVQMSPQDAQFIELGNLTAREICGAFRVPPYMVGDLEKANYNNMEQQDLGFAKHVIVPWCVRWEQELNRKLFSAGGGYYTKHSLQGLMRGDFKSRTEGLVMLVNNGLMRPNEGRDLEELDPYPDELNRPRIPLNIGMLDDDGKLMNAPAKPAADPQPQGSAT